MRIFTTVIILLFFNINLKAQFFVEKNSNMEYYFLPFYNFNYNGNVEFVSIHRYETDDLNKVFENSFEPVENSLVCEAKFDNNKLETCSLYYINVIKKDYKSLPQTFVFDKYASYTLSYDPNGKLLDMDRCIVDKDSTECEKPKIVVTSDSTMLECRPKYNSECVIVYFNENNLVTKIVRADDESYVKNRFVYNEDQQLIESQDGFVINKFEYNSSKMISRSSRYNRGKLAVEISYSYEREKNGFYKITSEGYNYEIDAKIEHLAYRQYDEMNNLIREIDNNSGKFWRVKEYKIQYKN